MLSYDDQLKVINGLPEIFSWDQINAFHKNENCNNLRELHAAETKRKRIEVNAEAESDSTKCLIVKKIVLLSDAINWRGTMRYRRGANANSISLGSYKKIASIRDLVTRKRVDDIIVASLVHNCHPFSLNPLNHTGLNEDIIDDIIEFCETGDVKPKLSDELYLRSEEGEWLRAELQRTKPKSSEDYAMMRSILDKLLNTKRYGGWA